MIINKEMTNLKLHFGFLPPVPGHFGLERRRLPNWYIPPPHKQTDKILPLISTNIGDHKCWCKPAADVSKTLAADWIFSTQTQRESGTLQG